MTAVAVLTLTRDRLDYTKHCFNRLHEFAGCRFDHFILDQGSQDGTVDWLTGEYAHSSWVIKEQENIGICRGLKKLLEVAFETDDYDIIVKFDNDCELVQERTLRDVVGLADKGGCILSPRILGLRNPPPVISELRIGDEPIENVFQIGGIFQAIPAWVFGEFRYSDNMLGDDVELCHWFRAQGGTCGYVKRLEAWHYRTTDGQHEDFPWYFDRRVLEGGPA